MCRSCGKSYTRNRIVNSNRQKKKESTSEAPSTPAPSEVQNRYNITVPVNKNK